MDTCALKGAASPIGGSVCKLPLAMRASTRGHAGGQLGEGEAEISKGSPDAARAALQARVPEVSLGLGLGAGGKRPLRPKDPLKRRSTVTVPGARRPVKPLAIGQFEALGGASVEAAQ